MNIKNVKKGMVLISDSEYFFTVVFPMRDANQLGEYPAFMATNEPGGGYQLLMGFERIFSEFHNNHSLREISDAQWKTFKEWIFEWIFETNQKVKIK